MKKTYVTADQIKCPGARTEATPLPSFDDLFVKCKPDDPVEAARLYKLNHNPERANREWQFLEDAVNKVSKLYLRLWGIK